MSTAETVEHARRMVVTRPPLPGPGVCRICRGPAREGSEFCWCCRSVCSALEEAPASMPHVLPIAAFRPGDTWSVVLRRYKDAPVVASRRHFSKLLSAVVERVLAAHGGCLWLQSGGFDAYCVVPTSRPQPRIEPPHPLESLLAGIGYLELRELVRLRPVKVVRHLQPSAEAFVPAHSSCPAGKRILLIDDSWVTGARALSAVVALRAAHATVAGALVIGRSVDPSASSNSRSWWADLGPVTRESGFTDDAGACSEVCLRSPARQ
jgi:hypothetical protein